MTIAEARTLFGNLSFDPSRPMRWMDLGCGTGTFTLALAELVPPGSSITAVDHDAQVLQHIPAEHHGIRITTQVGDAATMVLTAVDGILMANMLHFVADQHRLLQRITEATQQVLLVEYDTDAPRPPWVPYPISQSTTSMLFNAAGFPRASFLGTRPSRYGPEPLYAALFRKTLP